MQLTNVNPIAAHGRPNFPGFGAALKRALLWPVDFLISINEATLRAREVERLMAMSDTQLADIGLERSEIAAKVFGKV